MLFRSENPVLGPLTQIVWSDGSVHNLAGDNQSQFSGSAITNQRLIDAEPKLTATSVAVTGSVAAVRGNTTIASGTTVTSGFVYGTQGKVSATGSWTSANFLAGLIGQLDFSAVTAFTAGGPVQAIWGDMGASITGSITTAANANIVNLTNTTACAINAVLLTTAKASFFMDLNEVGAAGTWIVATAKGSGWDKSLKIKLNGTTYYIPCNSAAS